MITSSKKLASLLGRRLRDLEAMAADPLSYYREKLQWRNGKQRLLLVPCFELKLLQIRLHRNLLRQLPPHPCAFAVRGRGTIRAAECHIGRPWFYHRDIMNFYPSVTTDLVRERFRRLGVDESIADLLANLVTVRNQLPQGAPTSPAVGEIVLYRLDCRIYRLIHGNGMIYTRYADDITVSGGRHLKDRFASLLTRTITNCGWELNEKGGLFGPNERHEMLGLKVNHQLGVSNDMYDRLRRTLRLLRKGAITLDAHGFRSLNGSIQWVTRINPLMGAKLREIGTGLIEASA